MDNRRLAPIGPASLASFSPDLAERREPSELRCTLMQPADIQGGTIPTAVIGVLTSSRVALQETRLV